MLQLIERGFFKSTPIKFSEAGMPANQNPDVQVFRVGKFNHPRYGEFEITPLTLQEMKQNFDNKIRGVDIAFDYFHNSDEEASGWPTDLYLSEDLNELWARVDWTPKARQKLSEREIRYFSPDFAFQWEDPETGQTFKNVLFGGGLTNRPFVKDMAAIVATEQEREQMKLEELETKLVKLSEDNEAMKKKMAEMADAAAADKKDGDDDEGKEDSAEDGKEDDSVEGLKKQLAEAKKELAEYAESHKKLLAEKAKAEEAKQMAEKETHFNLLMSEGKACAAQKEAFLKNNMIEFVKLSQPLNLNGHGSASSGGDAVGDRDDRVLKLAESKVKADPKLKLVDAITLANKEIK